MKNFTCLFLFAVIYIQATAQVFFYDVPINKQIVPRNLSTNKGTIKINGVVYASNSPYTKIEVMKFRNNVFQQTYIQTLTYYSQFALFSFTIPVNAELANYKLEIYGVTATSNELIKTVDSLAAGDAFIIQGQSNAVATKLRGSSNKENQNSFIRVWGSAGSSYNHKWFIADGDAGDAGNNDGNAGQWGLRLAKRLLDSQHIPIVIFNGARGGKPISFFQESNTGVANNYSHLLDRVTESGFKNNIRAIFWYQGESDSNPGNSVSAYKKRFFQLYADWKNDYKGFQHLYIIQIKQSCFSDAEASTIIQEAHRQLAQEINNTTIFATNGLEHYSDQCHYGYSNGYKKIGDYLFPLVNRDIYYADNTDNVASPQVKKIIQTASNKLTLYFKNTSDAYFWEAGTENDFVINNTTAKIINGIVNGSTIVLTMNKNLQVASLSFYGHTVGGSPCIRNLSGEGMVGFYKFHVSSPLYSNTLKLNGSTGNNYKLNIYPVPAHDNLFLQYQLSQSSVVSISVVDITGNKVLQLNDSNHPSGINQSHINISALAKGVYVLKLETASTNFIGKFIKE